MKSKKAVALLLSVFLLVMCASCGEVNVSGTTLSGTEVDTSNAGALHGLHLRDKEALYSQYDNKEVVTMYLTVSSGNSGEGTNHTWKEVNTYSVYDYDRMGVDRYKVEGLLQVGDENGLIPGELGYGQVSPNCTIQIRGQSSSRSAQKNYKVKLKENKGTWREQTTIALNKHSGDCIRIRNKLMYDLITGVEQIMGLRTTFVHLYVKDTTAGGSGEFEDYGLYTQVEQLNKKALKAHGLDKNGHLYKINVFEFYRYEDVIMLKDDPAFNEKAFEELLECKGDDDHTKLINLLDKVNDYSISIDDILKEHFDIENLTYWMAFQILTGNVDTQSRNFYIYSPLNTERWYILPWDNDAAFKRTEYDITGISFQGGWEEGVSNYWGNVLFNRCLKSEAFREALDVAIEDLKVYLSPERINSLLSTYSSIAKPYVYRAPDVTYAPLTASEYDTVIANIASEVVTNYNVYKESFQKPMPFYIGVPRKGENKLTIEWDSSYDFNQETVTYTFELARDCYFKELLSKQQNLKLPIAEITLLPPGQYFIRVIATNESGKSQPAFDYYSVETGKLHGVKCFYVDANGAIVEDVYVEA